MRLHFDSSLFPRIHITKRAAELTCILRARMSDQTSGRLPNRAFCFRFSSYGFGPDFHFPSLRCPGSYPIPCSSKTREPWKGDRIAAPTHSSICILHSPLWRSAPLENRSVPPFPSSPFYFRLSAFSSTLRKTTSSHGRRHSPVGSLSNNHLVYQFFI